ncbi:hypothetical protein [Haloarcula rubripromontorii]|uniref:hypothetical protein n=1 Tax=Haloarcula rubripromontorii TaxID=1705562 RepID=UPI00345C174E
MQPLRVIAVDDYIPIPGANHFIVAVPGDIDMPATVSVDSLNLEASGIYVNGIDVFDFDRWTVS